jgi:ribonuclease D
MKLLGQQVVVSRGDLDQDFYRSVVEIDELAWDIETSGLDWRTDRIGTCQVATASAINIVVLDADRVPKRLTSVLESPDIQKVFHHAPFDLRFMASRWRARPRNVACTKIASKVLAPELVGPEHSLQPVLERYLGITISKDQQRSDWLAKDLTEHQLRYAAADVAHLLDLKRQLVTFCEEAEVLELLYDSWAYLPTRVMLDLRGAGDVFAY